jgi:hypothetical protein
MGATVKGCFNVATALLAAFIQLSAILALEVREAQELQNVLDASRRNPSTAESSWSFSAQANPQSDASFATLENCKNGAFLTLFGEAHSLIDCIFADDRSLHDRELLKVERS